MKRKPSAVAEALFWDCAISGSTVPLRVNSSRCWYVQATSANVNLEVSNGAFACPGQELEVVFRQDAVGGRTVTITGSGGAVMVGGGTSAPASGANELTTYRFRQVTTSKVSVSKQIA